MTDELTVDEMPEEDIQSPGELLLAGRERLGLTEADVAEQLNLGMNQIKALEANRFGELPGKTYVLGYLKAYARLVGCDEAEVLKNFDLPEDITIRGIRPVAKAGERRSFRWKPVLVVVVVVALAGTGFLWWQESGRDLLVSSQSGTITSARVPVTTGGDGVAMTIESDVVQPASNEPTSGRPFQPEISETEGAEPEQDLRARIEAEEQAGEAAGMPAGSAAGDERTVELEFVAASWVDLRDSDGERLLYEHINQGKRIVVEGAPPFSVFLGNADGVRIMYQGEPFDFSEYQNGVYARFSLGKRG